MAYHLPKCMILAAVRLLDSTLGLPFKTCDAVTVSGYDTAFLAQLPPVFSGFPFHVQIILPT